MDRIARIRYSWYLIGKFEESLGQFPRAQDVLPPVQTVSCGEAC